MRKINKSEITIGGKPVEVPWKSSVAITANGEVREIVPPYINNLMAGNYSAAVQSIRREIIRDIQDQNGLRVKVLNAPIAVSGTLGEDEYCFDGHRLIFNEKTATFFYHDADGDMSEMIKLKDQNGFELDEGIAVKAPVHNRLRTYKRVVKRPLEYISSLTIPADYPSSPDPENYFLKRHMIPNIGMITRAWDRIELKMGVGKTYEEKCSFLLAGKIDPQTGRSERSQDLEDRGMKLVRKDSMQEAEFAYLQMPEPGGLNHAWIFASKIPSFVPPVENLNLPYLVNCSNELKHEDWWMPKKKRGAPEKETIRLFHGTGLFAKLVKMGIIELTEIPSTLNTPKTVLVVLKDPKGNPAALVDNKRENEGDSLSYAWVLYPVYDDALLYNVRNANNHFQPSGWLSPAEFLEKRLCEFDASIRAHSGGPVLRQWPKNRDEFYDEKRAVKLEMLRIFLAETLGEYGDNVPVTFNEEGKMVISKETQRIARNTFTVDYGKAMSTRAMLITAKKADDALFEQYGIRMCIAGNKGKNPIVRKYLRANAEGGAFFAPLGVHVGRPGMNRSQLLRSLREEIFTVAVVDMDVNQILITKTGIHKQWIKTGYLDRVVGTLEEAEKLAKELKVTPKQVEYSSLTGEPRTCWTFPARATAKIGKLVDELGNKFMPRAYPQAMIINDDLSTEPIDLIMPSRELLDKGNFQAFTKRGEWKDVQVDTPDGVVQIRCLVVKRKFFRTGTESENIPARTRMKMYRGLEKHVIRQVAKNELGVNLEFEKVDYSYVNKLQEVCKEILKFIPRVDPRDFDDLM